MKLSIIIVNYNTYQLTKQTIESVYAQEVPWAYEIMLVDNASSDGSIEALQQDFKELIDRGIVKVLCNNKNLGFSKANNRGIRESTGTYVLLLNSDTYAKEGTLVKCIDYMEQANSENVELGALGCKIVLQDGVLDHACKRGFPTPEASLYYFLGLHKKNPKKYGAYEASHLGENEIGEVECLMGAFMLMPRRTLDDVGLLDEDFFMYGEDIDLCYRIKEGGYSIVYYPEAQIIHYKGGSSKKRRTKIIYDFHHAMWLFYKKHYKEKYNKGVTLLVYVGIKVKYMVALAINALK